MGDLRDQMVRVSARRKVDSEKVQAKRDEESRERLKRIVSTKIKTSFIGALARFEEAFGEFWGDGIPLHRLSPEQLEWRQRWEKCREAILDNGHDQIWGALNEIDLHSVIWKGYRHTFEGPGLL